MAFKDQIRLPVLNLIHRRQRLLKLLTEFIEGNQRLISIYAPGGYGKTILLADFAQTTDLPVCWCSLEAEDRDPTHFLTLLAHSITDRFREIEPDTLLELVRRSDTQVSIRRIADSLADVGPHIIIIDDYHKAVSASMTLALNSLLEQLPEAGAIIVAARGDISLETGRIIDLLIAERATGLSEVELAFTGQEIQRVMRKRFGRQIDLDDAEEIAQATEGNIAQILLTGHIQSKHTGEMIMRLNQRLGGDRDIVYDYLATEVFGKQTAELQQFMLYTSVLPDMTVEMCNALLEMNEAQTHLETLLREDLFVTQKGAGFQYHDLFSNFLRSKLAENEGMYRQITIRAAQLLVTQTRFEEAINLYLSVQAWDEAAALLEDRGRALYDYGRALTINQWLEMIPEAEIACRPRLLLLQGQIISDDFGNPEQAMDYFEQAEKVFVEQNNPVGIAEAQICRSAALRMMGKASESLTLASSGLEQLRNLEPDEKAIARATRNRGLAHGTVGNLANSLSDLRHALDLYKAQNDTYREGLCHHDIGVSLQMEGSISAAGRHYRKAIQTWQKLGNANDMANTLNSLGVSLYIIGRYDEALKQFYHCLDIAKQIKSPRRAAFAWTSIGDVHLGQKKYAEALEAYAVSTELAREVEIRTLQVYNLVKCGECYYGLENLNQALNLANQARQFAVENGMVIEQGMACALLAKIYILRGEYEASFGLFADALACFSQNSLLEHTKMRLWAAYSLLLDLRTSAAFTQLQEALKQTLTMGELIVGLKQTVVETQDLLYHFLRRADTPGAIWSSINLLLKQRTEQSSSFRHRLQIFAFGSPILVINRKQKMFKQRGGVSHLAEFLLYLAVEGQRGGCRWDEVCATIWPDLEAKKASVLFHQNIRKLRLAVLGASEYITLRDDYYQIHYLKWCDVLAFEALYERAARASPGEALVLQLELINLYQGELLAGFDLSDWGIKRRTSCNRKFLQTVNLAGEQLLQNNDSGEALIIINKGLAQDYYRESLHRRALRAYAQLGLYDDLINHYAEMVKQFENALGVSPEPKSQALYEQLLANRYSF